MAKTGKTISEIRSLTHIELSFLYFWLRNTEREEREWWEKMLGVTWNVKDIKNRFDRSGSETAQYEDDATLHVPLALGINPDLIRGLYKMVTGRDPIDNRTGKDVVQSTKERFAEKGMEVEPMSREMMLAMLNGGSSV